MLISSVPRTLIKSPRLGAPTTSFNSASLSSRAISSIPVLTGDILIIGWGRINTTPNPPAIPKIFTGATNAGTVATNIAFVGPWGTTARGAFVAWYYRGLTPSLSQGFFYELYGTVSGTLGNLFQDFSLCFLDMQDWSGGVGNIGSGQNTANAASAAATITPAKNNSLLIGVSGFQDNTAAPLAASAGWDPLASLTTGSGGTGVDAAVGFFAKQNSDTASKTLTVSTAAALSAPAGYVGIVELF